MASFLASIFSKKFEADDREPLWFLTLPSIPYLSTHAGTTTTLGLTGMDPTFWVISFLLLMIQSVINVITAVAVYEFILKQQGTVQSYFIGYGIVCPVILYIPFILIPSLDLRNMTFLTCVAISSPALLVFRCMEAMHGVLPTFAYDLKKPHDKNSLSKFMLYYAASIQFNFDPVTEEIVFTTRTEIFQRTVHFARMFVESSILYSILLPCDYHPFPQREIHNVLDLFYWGNLGNNFLVAYLTGIALEAGVTGLALMTSISSGISTSTFNDNPLLASSSPSDFWGRRWNKIVGSGLRRGVFRPLRKGGYSRSLAAFATFVASGCLHEYVLLMMSLRGGVPNNPTGEPFVPSYGRQWIFFTWNGAVLLVEHALQGTAVIRFLQNNLPKPARTALVLLTVIPIAHFFTDEYVNSCFYSDISMGFPLIVKI